MKLDTILMKKKYTNNSNWMIIFPLFIMPFGILNNTVEHIFLYVSLPVAFIYSLFTSSNTIKNRYIKSFLILFLWSCICTVISSSDFIMSFSVIKEILTSFMFCYVIVALSKKNEKNIIWFYILIFSYYFVNWLYAIFHFDLFLVDITAERFGGETSMGKINANRFGYYTLFFTFATFIFGELHFKQRWRKIFRIIFLLFIIVVFFNAFVTGSRQVLLLNIPLYCILIFFRYKSKLFYAKVFLRAVIFITLIIIIGGLYLKPLYVTSLLKQRTETENIKEDYRNELTNKAINYGTENIIFGIGPGIFLLKVGSISHNSYTELFAETGIVGLSLYLLILLGCLNVQLKRYFKTKDVVFLYFAIYLVFYMIDDIFYIFYETYLLMGLFYLISVHSDLHFKKYHFITNKIKSNQIN